MFEFLPVERKAFNVFDPISDFDKDFFNEFFPRDLKLTQGFRTDVKDLGDAFELKSELPGYNKDDIKVSLDEKYLTITANRKEEKEEGDKSSYIRKERFYGTVTRRFSIEGIDNDAITASYVDGILTLTLPKKKAEAISRNIEIL